MEEVIKKHYDYQTIEKEIYQYWQENHFFEPKSNKTNKKFVVVIPPPNVTGRLHMGHALNITIQDMLARYHRMIGDEVLWVPGTDHAGIATQTVVKKMLDAGGVDYRQMGREKFVSQIWEWKEKYGGMILEQIKTLGASCDWSRTRFTMDESLSKAVYHAFKKLYEEGLIYRGERIVNWCPVDQTALSDDEVETDPEGESGFLYDIAYPIIKNDFSTNDFLVVSTTRPETIFGDVALAVHPRDSRYLKWVDQKLKVKIPLTNKMIPIITDEYVDPQFGTGCLKITPAHDPNDFEIGLRHGLEMINIMNPDATLNEMVPSDYRDLSREEARKKILNDLEVAGNFKGKQKRQIPLGRSYRSKAIIEYRLSKQWFIKVEPLAKNLLQKSDELNIFPSHLRKLWNYWLENIKDWCISRQIWWGHRIPVWYHRDTGEILVNEEIPEQVKTNPEEWIQEEDVLDTWFSSALWPMSVFGWPQSTSDFEHYFPTTTLSTAKDIIFFWVARMGLMSVFFENRLPFKNVYFHPTVMDHKGKIMSKSKGNGIDPYHIINGASVDDLKSIVLDVRPSNQEELLREIDHHYANGFEGVGADALRFTLIYLSSNMQSIQISIDNFVEIGRRFMTKFWNAARMVLGYLNTLPDEFGFDQKVNNNFIETLWFKKCLRTAQSKIIKSYEEMNFSNLGFYYYDLIWNDFCDWYLELSKERLTHSNVATKENAIVQLVCFFKQILIVLHPLVPFQTEKIFQEMKTLSQRKKINGLFHSEDVLMTKKIKLEEIESSPSIELFSILQEVVISLRSSKKQNQWDKERLVVYYKMNNDSDEKLKQFFEQEKNLIIRLAKLKEFKDFDAFSDMENTRNKFFFSIVKARYTLEIEIDKNIVSNNPLKQSKKEIAKLEKDLEFITKRLSNRGFIQKANPLVVEKEKKRKQELEIMLDLYRQQ